MARAADSLYKMESTLQASVHEYLAAGWALCPISERSKTPSIPGWNRLENAITRPDQADQITGNVGLLHAFSGTVSIDVDNVELANTHLKFHGIDLDGLLCKPGAVLIDSGRSNRCKLLYRYPEPIQYRKLSSQGLELRCADANGGSVQDVLPPSIHPNGNLYRWAGKGHFSDLPELPPKLLEFWLNCDNPTPVNNVQLINEGARNNTLTSLAGKLRNKGKDAESITELLLAANKDLCTPPLPANEVESIARSVSRYEPGDGIEDVGVIEEGDPLLPSGDYCVQYIRHKIIRNMHGFGPKIIVWFTVTEGEYQGSIIRAFYNIEVEGSKWRALPGSRLSIEIPRLFPRARKDRISPALLRNHNILVCVGTTKSGIYSTVKELLEVMK